METENNDSFNELTESIIKIFSEEVVINDISFNLAVSVGITCGSNANSLLELIEQADSALYKAKETPGINIKVYDPNK